MKAHENLDLGRAKSLHQLVCPRFFGANEEAENHQSLAFILIRT